MENNNYKEILFISTDPNRKTETYKKICEIPGITKMSSPLIGEYDMIARLTAKDSETVSSIINKNINNIQGVMNIKHIPIKKTPNNENTYLLVRTSESIDAAHSYLSELKKINDNFNFVIEEDPKDILAHIRKFDSEDLENIIIELGASKSILSIDETD